MHILGLDLSAIENVFYAIIELGILLLECMGFVVLVATAGKSIVQFFQRDNHVRLNLAQGIALSLEFKLGGEVLRTVVVREWSELGILGAIILLRGALTLLLHWEIKTERMHTADLLDHPHRRTVKKKKSDLSDHI